MQRKIKKEDRYKRHKRVRAKIYGTASQPRLCVFKSIKYTYAQLIDDDKGRTLVSTSDSELSKPKRSASNKTARAYEVGKLIAKKALEKNIKKIIFDRGGYKYHGRVKALAEGAREAGLKF